jgi:hypothetical protein
MFGFEIFGALEIGDRAGDLENPENRSRCREQLQTQELQAIQRDRGRYLCARIDKRRA